MRSREEGENPLFCYIMIDRKIENDAVFYDCDNEEFKRFVLRSNQGWKEAKGTCSDICYIASAANRAAVNLSVGYYNAHTKEEYVDLDLLHFLSTIIYKMICNQTIKDVVYEFEGCEE